MTDKRIVTLTLTNSCNLNCVYCYEFNKSPETMSFDVAKKIIDHEFLFDTETEIEFDLFGGEPFLNFELIKMIDDYLIKNYSNRKWILFTTTNGTVVDDGIKQWLKSRPYFYCGISLDGNKKMHNLNRSNSFDKIDVDFFLKQYPIQPVKMTISNLTLNDLAEGVIFLHNLGFKVDCNLAFGINWSAESNKQALERGLMKLIDFYLENPQIEPCMMLRYNIRNVLSINDEFPSKLRKWCGAGDAMHTYHTDGHPYHCQFFMPLSIGKEKAKKSEKIKFHAEIPIEFLDKKCQKCPYIYVCPSCYGSNFASFNNIYIKDDNLCELTKIIVSANSYFQAHRWKLGQLDLDENEVKLLLRGIKIVQDYMRR